MTASVAGDTGSAAKEGHVHRFTDPWVNRNGEWQVVASQATKVQS